MLKLLTRAMYSGAAAVFALVAMTNIGTTSWFMMYQPDPPKKY
ncbi:MAG: cyclic lactone autoinducer peptide [Erysipelothrix sp.]|nr:cyclic lactone autoinducer peptide [Erysipelothrix sp.]